MEFFSLYGVASLQTYWYFQTRSGKDRIFLRGTVRPEFSPL